MKILYCPIFEGGSVHETAVKHKRGLYNALVNAGHQVYEYDYLNAHRDLLFTELCVLIRLYRPDLMLTQLHGAEPLTPAMLAESRQLTPQMKVVNWSGDSWLHSLIHPPPCTA